MGRPRVDDGALAVEERGLVMAKESIRIVIMNDDRNDVSLLRQCPINESTNLGGTIVLSWRRPARWGSMRASRRAREGRTP
jgi:hypothetical protein